MDLVKTFVFEVVGVVPMGKPAWNRSRSSHRARKRSDPWLRSVRHAAAREAAGGPTPVFSADVPLVLEVTYWLPRPKSHFGTGRNAGVLKASAPAFPLAKPDLTNLTKGLEDVLADWPRGAKALVYPGDQQIVDHLTCKRFADGHPVGATVRIYPCLEEPT